VSGFFFYSSLGIFPAGSLFTQAIASILQDGQEEEKITFKSFPSAHGNLLRTSLRRVPTTVQQTEGH
jgi:hypothetical protein